MDLNTYQQFVQEKTSTPSKVFDDFIDSLKNLHEHDKVNVPQMLTAAVGLSAEAGEFTEIVKKMIFQGKPLNDENLFHLKRELGDAIFYWVMACSALGLDPEEVINENVGKLSERYKKGFTVKESENRKTNDI